jgi:hypothetical protein
VGLALPDSKEFSLDPEALEIAALIGVKLCTSREVTGLGGSWTPAEKRPPIESYYRL